MDYQYKIALRLKLRQTSGEAFQDFFSTVMGKLHGDDFVRVRPFGQKGLLGVAKDIVRLVVAARTSITVSTCRAISAMACRAQCRTGCKPSGWI